MKVNYNKNSCKVVTPAFAKYKAEVKMRDDICNNVGYTSSYRKINDWLDEHFPDKHEGTPKSNKYTFGRMLACILPWCTCAPPDNTMSPTLEMTYDIIGWKTKKRKRLDRFAVITAIVYNPDCKFKQMICRRIIGMPGDTVKIYGNGLISVNNKRLREPYIKDHTYKVTPQTIIVPDNQYFVLGDNRKKSWDSRDFGCIKYNQIKYVITRGLSPTSCVFERIEKLSKLS